MLLKQRGLPVCTTQGFATIAVPWSPHGGWGLVCVYDAYTIWESPQTAGRVPEAASYHVLQLASLVNLRH